MRKCFSFLLALCLALGLTAPAQAAAAKTKTSLTLSVAATSYPARARTLLSKINTLRRQNDLPEYVMLADLEKVALQRAVELFVHFDHKRPDLTKYYTADDGYAKVKNCEGAGENIAAGLSSASQVMEDWQADEDMLANLLAEDFTHVGIACVQVPGSYNGTYWCLYFQQHKDGFSATKAAAKADAAGVKKTVEVVVKKGLFTQADASHKSFLLEADDLDMNRRKSAEPTVWLADKRGVKLGEIALDDLTWESADTSVCTVLKSGLIKRKAAGETTVTAKFSGLGSVKFAVTLK